MGEGVLAHLLQSGAKRCRSCCCTQIGRRMQLVNGFIYLLDIVQLDLGLQPGEEEGQN